ncbi:MAG: rod-binding protein [Fidelibacterota bacterium]
MNTIDNIQEQTQVALNQAKHRPLQKGQAIPREEKARELALKKTSRDLEATFLTFLVRSMEKTVPKSELLGSKNSLSSMMFSSVIAQSMADQGNTGISEMIYRALSDGSELPRSDSLFNLSDPQIKALSDGLTPSDK